LSAAVAAGLWLSSCGGGETAPSLTQDVTSTDIAAGKSVFLDEGCGNCHTLAAAGTTGTVGPNLDEHLMENEESHSIDHILEQVRQGGNGMPAFAGKLTEQEIQAVARFVFEATKS
jgi:mono/diheme cytochrome c family protein